MPTVTQFYRPSTQPRAQDLREGLARTQHGAGKVPSWLDQGHCRVTVHPSPGGLGVEAGLVTEGRAVRLPWLLPGGVGRPQCPSRICTTCSNHSKVKPQNSLSWGTYNRQTRETGSEQREEPGPRAPGPGWQGPRAPVHEPGRQVCGLRGCEDLEGPIHGHSAVLRISVWTDTNRCT